ncbi:MAG: HATPase domain-containing multisensor signal transduction histidine kinase [Parcubacteria group bacterium GW2011_GWA2_49_9]|nr:MAG: HATPase domain-containing multisensor signal transduction histidine kinase [Parcubacteria group bacterium GW2011_GWA2_49_9]
MQAQAALCFAEAARYLVLSSHVPKFIYYTHLTALSLSLVIGLFVYFKDRRSLTNKILFWSLVPFLLWVFFNVIIWASNRSDLIMFLWSLQIMLEPLTYIGMFYLVYVFVNKHDAPLNAKVIAAIVYTPLILITPTIYSLEGFDLSLCIPIESFYAYYTYVLELLSIIGIATYAIRRFLQEKSADTKREIALLATGVILFLLMWASGNIFGSFTDDWVNSQFGLFGTPIFAAFIGYLVVRYKMFNVKLLGTQVLVGALWMLVVSLLFLRTIETVRIIVSFTAILLLIVGIYLIWSVKREVEQRERIEKLARELESANARLKELDHLKSEFVSLASHQIRGPLTAIKGYASMMTQGDYGVVPENLKEIIQTISNSSNALAVVVQDFLDVSRIEQGKMKYDFSDVDFSTLVSDVAKELTPNVERKHLSLTLDIAPSITVHADAGKVRQVIENLVDNALKYTPKGSILVAVKRTGAGTVQLSVKDTGVGIKPEVLPRLFQKFSRAEDASKANILGTGLGLYVARQLIEAQKGKVWAESDGEGKGSTFFVELPTK